MMNYRTVTLSVAGLFLSVSFLASSVVAMEKDGVTMKDGKMMMMKDGKEMHMKDGQMMMMDGKMMEGDKGKMGEMGK